MFRAHAVLSAWRAVRNDRPCGLRSTFDEAIRTPVRTHPYTALAIADLLGFA